jgi:hypothetical protein
MRVLLRNRTTRLYYAGANRWAAEQGEALDCASVPRAARLVIEEKLPEIDIILQYASVPDEVVVPVLPEWCDFDRQYAAVA